MSDAELLEVQRRLQRQHGIDAPEPPPNNAAAAAGMLNMAASLAERGGERETEYLGPDGLLRCKVCGGPRQTIITPPFEGAKPRTVRCWCGCPTEYERLQAQEKQWEKVNRRMVCFEDFDNLKEWTFDKDDGKRPELIQAAKEYAEQFPQYMKDGRGLLLYGDVDGGKSVAAACIANRLIEKGYKPKMTSLGIEADKVWAAHDKAAYIRDLCSYDLLIFDDLGVERQTGYMKEMVYKIINARSVQGGPMIVTTNLTKEELGRPAEIEYRRIYSRILERCLAIHVEGAGRRMQTAGANKLEMREQLGIGGADT